MQLTTALVLLGLSAPIFAQSGSAASAAPAASVSPTPQQICLGKCTPGDVSCEALCVGVPAPGDPTMNDVTDCVASCDQGDGSEKASQAYSACRDKCISSYITTTTGGAKATKAADSDASGTSSSSDAEQTGSADESGFVADCKLPLS